LGDARRLIRSAGHLSSRAAALPVDDQRGRHAVVQQVFTVEALGQDVDEEAADELADVERHRLVAARSLDPIVLDLEG
jgi:hypothetical protein